MVARTGIVFLMIAFGAAFGYTVMARMSLLIGRLTDLIEFSDVSYGRPTWWLLILTIGAVLGRRLARFASQPNSLPIFQSRSRDSTVAGVETGSLECRLSLGEYP